MPKTTALPKYRKHRASGQAIVTLRGRDHYLGRHGTKTSLLEYDRLIAEWLAAGRQLPQSQSNPRVLTVVELLAAYLRHCREYYRKDGVETRELEHVKLAIKVACELYGSEPSDELGPLRLQAIQRRMVDRGWSRVHINSQISRIVRGYKWGVQKELLPAAVYDALRTVSGLRKGRSDAVESRPVLPIGEDIVQMTLPHLPATVADMIRLQRLIGCRPSELCDLRPCDFDRSGDVWLYAPQSHKTEHHGRSRGVAIGPRAQKILAKYLLRGADEYCFSPTDSERKRRAAASESRKTPLSCDN